jgi:hypothetical protein
MISSRTFAVLLVALVAFGCQRGASPTTSQPPAATGTDPARIAEDVDRILTLPEVVEALEASSCAFQRVQERSGHEQWRHFFGEVLVRSLSNRSKGMEPRETGLLFEHFLTSELREWDASEAPLQEVVVSALQAIAEEHCFEGSADCAAPDEITGEGSARSADRG